MRKSDRVLAAGIAIIVWLVVGFAIASRPDSNRAHSADDAPPVKAWGVLPSVFL